LRRDNTEFAQFQPNHQIGADPVVTAAILDRLLRHSHMLTIRGESYLPAPRQVKQRPHQAARRRQASAASLRLKVVQLDF